LARTEKPGCHEKSTEKRNECNAHFKYPTKLKKLIEYFSVFTIIFLTTPVRTRFKSLTQTHVESCIFDQGLFQKPVIFIHETFKNIFY